jgi:hypothetical protein
MSEAGTWAASNPDNTGPVSMRQCRSLCGITGSSLGADPIRCSRNGSDVPASRSKTCRKRRDLVGPAHSERLAIGIGIPRTRRVRAAGSFFLASGALNRLFGSSG